ncbi:hypothetical protein [Microbacterium sp. UFMG61]|uniref:hypothetical protein n=1 Tax=Microbacterium sp. UFMG61 TaxID=2745935 RepID=UPI00188F23DE|nr:hypothetical protein [Microbacterium sp. UFMG61]
MTASFAIRVGGDPAAIRGAAEWMRHSAEKAASEGDLVSGDDAINTSTYWQGASATAFIDISFDLVQAAREITEIAGPFAEAMHVFAGRIERMREHFDGYLQHAQEIGLRVVGDEVFRSVWVGAVPQTTDDPSWDDWQLHQRLERDYGRMQRDVVDWHADHEIWISENLVALAAGISDTVSAEEIRATLREGASTILDGGATYLDIDWTSRIARLQADAKDYHDLASEMVRKSGVTNDPALRARLQEKLAAGLPDTFNARGDDFETFSEFLTNGRRVLEVTGPAGDVVFGVWDIAEGEAPLDVAVEWAGGALGGVVGAEVAAMLAFPAIASVGLGAGGAALVGWAASEVWGTVAPTWKEGIYEFVADGFIIAGDMGESVGDWFYDVSETLSHSD